uniref:Portal n=1 Tax=Siphoviridae sp. ctAkS7 TaxID=2827798 RepID=A0A8S5SY50_9CAUD|nr:MAG TPA: portal [Siphoviridae sp. ctAkS7]
MSFSYIEPENLKQEYEQAKNKMAGFFKDFSEFERIANAEPKNVKEGNPDVTDATTASFIETRPKAIVQKNPTGKVVLDDKSPELSELLNEVVDNVILPNAITGGSVKTKCLSVVRNMLIYGSQPALVFIRNEDNYFGADFTVVDIQDVYLEPGKTNAKDCNYIFLNTWYTKSDIKNILYNEKELAKDKDYKTTWNLKKLEELQEKTTAKDTDISIPETEQAEFIKLVCVFQRGVDNVFYTFDPDTGEIVREWKNIDPSGKIPIIYAYYDPDGKNPLGLSAIRLTRRLQDMLDIHHQNYQFQVGLKSAPPTKIRGNVNTESIVYEPYAVWDLGSDPNADAAVVQTDNTLINTFPTVQGILKSNILNITNNGDTSISAEVGNPGFSKTPAGVNAQQDRINIADNYLRGQFEEWFGEILETMLNLHIAAHYQAEIDQVVPLSQRFIETKRKIDPEFRLTKETIKYSDLKDLLVKFKVDASSSKLDNDHEQLETLKDLLQIRLESGDQMEKYLKIAPLVYQIVKRSGVPDAEEIAPKVSEEDETSAEAIDGSNPMFNPLQPQDQAPEQANMSQPEAQPEVNAEQKPNNNQAQINPELVAELVQNGLTEEQAQGVAAYLAQGGSPEEVDEFLRSNK